MLIKLDKDKEQSDRLTKLSSSIFWVLMTDATFETEFDILLQKPKYFYGHAIQEDDNGMVEGLHRWLRTIGDSNMFLPEMPRMHTLSYLQHLVVPRKMEWALVKSFERVTLGRIGCHQATTINGEKGVIRLLSGSV